MTKRILLFCDQCRKEIVVRQPVFVTMHVPDMLETGGEFCSIKCATEWFKATMANAEHLLKQSDSRPEDEEVIQ